MLNKSIGESSLTRIFELIEDKVNILKGLIDEKSANDHSHSASSITGLHDCATTGNAITIDGKSVVISNTEPTSNNTNVITIVL